MEIDPVARQFLESFADTLYNVNRGGVGKRWPQPYVDETMEADLLCASSVLRRFDAYVRRLMESGRTLADIAKLYPYPSVIARFPLLVRGKDALQLSKEEQVRLTTLAAHIAASAYKSDPFCAKKTNILWTQEEQRKHIDPAAATPAGEETQDLLAQIDGKLWMYTEAIFTRWHNLGHEFHGPYTVGGERVLVKEWHDLRPDNWDFTSAFPHETIRTLEFYKDVDVKLDLHNRMETDAPLKRHITKFSLTVGDTVVADKQALRELSAQLGTALERAAAELEQFTKELAIRRNGEMMFYVLKPLADALGEDWQPSEACYAHMRKGTLTAQERDAARKHKEGDHSREGELVLYAPWLDFPA